jgi:proteic killer suppression protein
MPIRSFKSKAIEDINHGRKTKASLQFLPVSLHASAQIKLARLSAAETLMDLQSLRGNRLEKLKGDRQGQYRIRLNGQYRICFRWEENGAEDVEIVDYH